jgi:translocation and assembly module TamA
LNRKSPAIPALLLGLCCGWTVTADAEPRAQVAGVPDEDLRQRIEQAIGDVEGAPATRFEARRRARDAAERATAVLRSEGYYAAETVPEVSTEEPPRATVRVTPGQRFVLAAPELTWIDPPPEAVVAGEAAGAIDLDPGAPARAADVLAAEGRVVAALAERGYPDARAGERQVVVDHAAVTLKPTYRIDAGSLVRLDGIQVTTEGRTNPQWVSALAPWRSGAVYRPEDVAELERRLLDTGVYDSVTVALAPPAQTRPDGLRPVTVSLADRPRRTVELGAGWSTSEGVGVDGRFTWYNRLRRADTLALDARYADLEQRLGVELTLPHWKRPAETLRAGAQLFREDTDAYERYGVSTRADLTRRFGKTSFLTYGASLDLSQERERIVENGVLGTRERNLAVLAAFGGFTLDRSDDPLNPTRGWRLLADVQPTAVTGSDTLLFLRNQAQGSIYVPLDEAARSVVSARLRLGTILGGDIPTVPVARRFFSGGGGSVRGYEYQGIGPRLSDGTPRGGLSLIEGTLEGRRQIIGPWTGAAFIEFGSVGDDSIPNFQETRFSVGIGARYDLGFAPVRVDVAVPLDRSDGQPAFQLYVSLGQAF